MADAFSSFLGAVAAPPAGAPPGMPPAGSPASAMTPLGMPPPKIPSPDEYERKGEELLKRERADRKPLEEKSQANVDRMMSLAKELRAKEAPTAPKLQDVPDAPNAQYQDPMQALGSMGTVLALFGSLRTRAPLTAALNSAAASMQAFHKGDQERVKLEREKWHDNMEKAMQQNQIEMQRYTNALQTAKFDIEKARPEFEAIAADNKHNTMLMAAQHGDYQQMFKLYDGGVKLQEKMLDVYVKDQEFRLRQADLRQRSAETAQYRKDSLQIRRDQMEAKAEKDATKAVEAGKPTERALDIIEEMKGIIQTNTGVTGVSGMARRPLESVLSMLGGPESGPAHQYESLARELQNVLRQTSEFHYKGRTLSKEVADRDVMVRGLKFGDTGSISMDQLTHLENMLTGQGAGYTPGGAPKPAETKILDGKKYSKDADGQWWPD